MKCLYSYILIIFLCASCIFSYDPKSDVDSRMTIINKSSESVYFFLSDKDSLTLGKGILPYDIIKKTDKFGVEKSDTIYSNLIPAGAIDTIFHFQDWEATINSYSEKVLFIYFFEKKILFEYSWSQLVDEQVYSSKKRYSINELSKMNWYIEYP